jgi:hypothetical protein
MSFSSFSLFNFYQQPNTGHEPTSLNTGILLSGNAESGKVADFNWYFPYASTNILINSVLSQSRFGFHIWADSNGGVTQGLHYARVSTSMSGSFGANFNSIYLSDKFYGVTFPQIHESGSIYTTYSGRFTGVKYDSVSEHNVLSGRASGQKYDTVSITNGFSGSVQSSADQLYVNSILSGIINQAPNDTMLGQSKISGSFWPSQNDLCSLSYTFAGLAIASGMTLKPYTVNDSGNLVFSLIGYQVNS